MENKISIIIPIYKVEKYLDKCVESVVNQTYKNLEIILVDDGSPDNCPKMCDEWAKKDKRIKVIHKENGGLSDARNKGLDIATGDHIMFLDSDDYVSTQICEKLLDLSLKNNADISMCDLLSFYEDEDLPIVNANYETIVLNRAQIIEQIYKPTLNLLMVAVAKLYKKEVLKNIRYPIGRLHEDEFVIHRVIYEANNFAYTTEKLYYYLKRRESITAVKKQKNITDVLEAFKNRYDFLNEKFPENKNRNNLFYIGMLRAVYATKFWATKELKNEILKTYKSLYKQTKHVGFKNRLFYHFPHLTAFVFKKIKRLK